MRESSSTPTQPDYRRRWPLPARAGIAAFALLLLLLAPPVFPSGRQVYAQDPATLRLTLDNGVGEIEPGQSVVYQLRLENLATASAAIDDLRMTLPPELTFLSATTGGQENPPGSGTIVWAPFNLDGEGQTTRAVTAKAILPMPEETSQIGVEASATRAGEGAPPTVSAADTDPLLASVIEGAVWHDLNGDGLRSGEEPGLAGVTVQITTQNATLAPLETNAAGEFRRVGLGSGAYTINLGGSTLNAFPLHSGQESPLGLTLTPGATQTANLGYAKPAAVAGQVWRDDSGADGPVPLTDVGVFLRNEEDLLLAEARTGASGAYQFTNLPPGAYSVTLSTDGLPPNFAGVFEADGTPDQRVARTLTSGQQQTGIDFGLAFTGAIDPGLIWRDGNENGLPDTGEAGISTVSVERRFAGADDRFGTMDDDVATTTTDADGRFSFSDLTPGRHRLRVLSSTWRPEIGLTADPDGIRDGQTEVTIRAGETAGPLAFGYGRHDLAIRQQSDANQYETGATVRYRISYGNAGSVEAGQAVLRATVPENSRYDAASSSPDWTCADRAGPGTLCDLPLGVLGVGHAGEATFAVTIAPVMPAGVNHVMNTVQALDLAPGWIDGTPANNRTDLAVQVVAAPALTLDLADDGGVRVPGEQILYTIAYANQGNQDADGVTLTVTVPANTRFAPDGSDPEWTCAGAGQAGDHCALALGHLAAGAVGETRAAVRIEPTLPVNVATIGALFTLEDAAGHTDSAARLTPVESAPDLEVEIVGPGETIARGATIEYPIAYRNVGNQDAVGVLLIGAVPRYTTFRADLSTPGWDCPDGSGAGTPCILAIGPLPAGEAGEARFAVLVDPDMPPDAGGIDNSVIIVGSDVEQDVANNQDGGVIAVTVPSAIDLLAFTATPQASGAILITWETGRERDVGGFLVYRGTDATWQGTTRITPALIPGQGGETAGAVYAVRDEDTDPDVVYFYWLQELAQDNTTVIYGPVTAQGRSGGATSGAAIYLPVIRHAAAMTLQSTESEQTVSAWLASDGRFTIFADLFARAGLDDLVATDRPLTLFAPTDEAFTRLENRAPGTLTTLQADPYGELTRLLLYHMVAEDLTTSSPSGWFAMATLEGSMLDLAYNETGTRLVNQALVNGEALVTPRGTIFPLDTVLIPPHR
jgi:uncharacterized repeat protein (TIGR01451 family)